MFISWGSRTRLAEVGPAGHRHCASCDKDSGFTRMVEYDVRHIYWIFRWVPDRTPYLIYGNCGASHMVDQDDYDSPEVRKAIPAWDRRGWLVGLGGIGALVATGTIAAAANHESDRTYVAAPHVGDLYEADLARMMVKPEAPLMYTVLRVTNIRGDQVEVEIGKRYYDDWRGVERDIDDGAAASPGYYGGDRTSFPKASIQRMFDEGVFHDVRR